MVQRLVGPLVEVVAGIGEWSYLVLFAGAALESAAFVGLLVPGETLTIFSGFLASAGVLDLPQTIAVAAAGATLGDTLGYAMGRRLGRPWLGRHGHRIGAERVACLERLVARHGGTAVLLGRFVGLLRTLVPFVAGTSRMPYRRFLVFNAAGAVLWAVGTVLLGYVRGTSWRLGERWIGRAGLVAAVLAAVAAIFWARRRLRRELGG